MKRIVGLIAEIMFGGLFGGLAVRGAQELVGPGGDQATYEVLTIGGYMLGVIAGVIAGGNGVGVGGSSFLTFLGALLGAILVRVALGQGLLVITSLTTLVESSLLSIAILGPILAAFGYNLGRGET